MDYLPAGEWTAACLSSASLETLHPRQISSLAVVTNRCLLEITPAAFGES